ncbi:MAG: CHAT domain-containing protein [Bacteroidaceae bacterium]|nr:CHAT domain-containing protein [Bacteroidaceae bacterium]
MSKNVPSIIHYIALLGVRDQMRLTNIPPESVTHPMLRYIGYMPQHMMHFIYGSDYYQTMLERGLQVGYQIIFAYPDSVDSIEQYPFLDTEVYAFLVCTDDYTLAPLFRTVVARHIGPTVFTVVPHLTKGKWQLPGKVAESEREVMNLLYEMAERYFEIDSLRMPFCVPVIQSNIYDKGHAFTPSRVNTQTLNAMLGNWGYEEELTRNEYVQQASASSKQALQNKDGFDRQNLLLEQIAKMTAIENFLIKQKREINTFEDQYRAPLIIAIPYNSVEMRRPVDSALFSDEEEREYAELVNAVLNIDYTHNYTIDVQAAKVPDGRLREYIFLQKRLMESRMQFIDAVATLHCSVRFSPYLRLPILGKNINAELSFVGISGLKALTKSDKTRRSIRKAMERIGRKIVEKAVAPRTVNMMKQRASQIVAMTDLPVEWMMIEDVPLGFTHDICRLPETPIPSLLTQYEEAHFTPYVVPRDILHRTLVVFGNQEPDFMEAQSIVCEMQQALGFEIRTCLTVAEYQKAIDEVQPELLVIDTHGDVDERTHQSFLMMGDEFLDGEAVAGHRNNARLVFLSACNTFTTCNTVSTIANAFFQAGALSVVTSYMPLEVMPATLLYIRMLRNLHEAANRPIHKNWLAFMSHLLRTSYIHALIEEAARKGIALDAATMREIGKLSTKSMSFYQRRRIYQQLKTGSLSRRVGVNYDNVIPHYLMYSTLGRADMIRFASYMGEHWNKYDWEDSN